MDALLGAFVIALGGLTYWLLYQRTRDALHPLALFAGIWLAVFGFAHFNVARSYDEPYYAEPFGLLTYLVVFAALVSFAFGFWLVDPEGERLDREGLNRRLGGSLDWSRLALVTVALFAAASAMTAFQIARLGEIPLFSPRIDQLRTEFKLPLLGYVYDLHYAVALFGTMLAVRRDGVRRWAWGAVVLASVLQLAFAGVRVSPMTALAWSGIYLLYWLPRVKVRHMVAGLALALTVFTVIEQYRRTMYEYNPALVNPRLDLSAPATAWAHTAAGFKNVQYTLRRVHPPLHMGLTSYDLPKTVYPAARDVNDEISYIYGTHNTPTFLSFLYFDFGWAGLLIMPGVYGALTAFVYGAFRRRTNLFWLVVYIDFLLAAVLAFRTHRYLGNQLIWFGGVALAVYLVTARRDAAERVPDPALRTGAVPA